MTRWRVGAAWSLFGLTSLLAAAQVVILARSRTPIFSTETLDDGFPLITLATVAASAVGVLIVSRYPGHRIGWLFLIGQVGTIAGLVAQSYGFTTLTEGTGPAAAGHWAMWVSVHLGGVFALTLVALLLLLVPDGSLLSPRWRWAVGLTVLGLVIHDGAALALDPGDLTAEGRAPGAPAWVPVLTLVGGLCAFLGLAAGAVALVIRLRRSRGERRAQLRWIAAAASALALSLPAGLLLSLFSGLAGPGAGGDADAWLPTLPLMVAYLALPVCTGVAILRWRLYDIDVILNRSIVLGVLTGFVAVGYVAVVVGLGGVTHDRAAWPSVVATAVVALAFQPVRRRASQLADRLVYGEQAVPYEALAYFNEELRRTGSVADLLPRMAEAAGRTMRAQEVRLWVDRPGEEPTVATWSSDGTGGGSRQVHVPVSDAGELLGGLSVMMPRGRPPRRSEQRLLDDFAAQLRGAFRAARLEGQLADRVELLARRSEELAESRSRLVTAQDAARVRFQAAIAEEVLPHLAHLPERLRRLEAWSYETRRWPRTEIDELIAGTNRGLEALRTLTRGIFPAQLTRRGLASALATHLDEAGAPGALHVDDSASGRFAADVESTAYFCAVELVRHLTAPLQVGLTTDQEELVLTVSGTSPTGLEEATRHLVDRAEALGGGVSFVWTGDEVLCTVRLLLHVAAPGLPDLEEPVGAEV